MHITLIGLGNPGSKYARNRHNAGTIFLDYLLNQYTSSPQAPLLTKEGNKSSELEDKRGGLRWKYEKYINADIAKIQLPISNFQSPTILAKPQTYMNHSGETVKKLITNYEIRMMSVFVVHDDLDIRLGNFKIQLGVGPKKHNGIDSIKHHLKTKKFWRIRIGVDNRIQGKNIPGEKYVLSNFKKEEREEVEGVFPHILERLIAILK